MGIASSIVYELASEQMVGQMDRLKQEVADGRLTWEQAWEALRKAAFELRHDE